MLRRLEKKTGLRCNPHVFRRSFATIQKILGTNISIIKELGGWESLPMVEATYQLLRIAFEQIYSENSKKQGF